MPRPPERASDEFFSGLPLPVDPEKIERELSRLWKPDPSQTGAVTRACLSNLVFHFPDASARECASGFLPELARRFPSRRILLTHRDGGAEGTAAGGGSIAAWITAVCHLPSPGAPAICCEQVILEAPRDAIDLFPGTVLPLLVPDVPVILVLLFEGGEPLADALERLIDRVIVDSRFRPLESLRFLASRLDRASRLEGSGPVEGSGLAGGAGPVEGAGPVGGGRSRDHAGRPDRGCRAADDLAWRAILPWRRLLADLFDEDSILRRAEGLREVDVSYRALSYRPGSRLGDGPRGPTEGQAPGGPPSGSVDGAHAGAVPAALLGGWLLSRLGWLPVGMAAETLPAQAQPTETPPVQALPAGTRPEAPQGTFERGGRRCALRLRPVPSEGPPAEVLGIRIASEEGGRRAVLTVGTETSGTGTPGTETQGTGTPGTETPGTGTPGTETQGAGSPGTETQGARGVFTIHDETEDACILPRRVPRRNERPAALLGAAVERVTSQEVLRGAVEAAMTLLGT